jgi:hypothetical protein
MSKPQTRIQVSSFIDRLSPLPSHTSVFGQLFNSTSKRRPKHRSHRKHYIQDSLLRRSSLQLVLPCLE